MQVGAARIQGVCAEPWQGAWHSHFHYSPRPKAAQSHHEASLRKDLTVTTGTSPGGTVNTCHKSSRSSCWRHSNANKSRVCGSKHRIPSPHSQSLSESQRKSRPRSEAGGTRLYSGRGAADVPTAGKPSLLPEAVNGVLVFPTGVLEETGGEFSGPRR